MSFSPEKIHELVGLAARISAIVSLARNAESRAEMDLDQADRDLKAALARLAQAWDEARYSSSTKGT